jgi:eukaryotic-like serine/threonine-protein kinase
MSSPRTGSAIYMHIICPHCSNPVEILASDGATEVLCPSCGSTFRTDTQATVSWNSPKGRQLGRFELIASVGMGAFGTVYKARDPQLDRTVAIKVPRAGNLADSEDLDRFLREGRSVARLRHPGIVPVHEVGLADDVPYLVSEFIEGPNLADVLTARTFPSREAAGLVADVAVALQYAHEQGVVHRDVKPSNIVFDADGKPHLMDFGLAKRDAGEITMTQDGQVLGTPAYMSPEQARGEAHRVDGRSDIYSLGVVLYHLVTAELPFRGNVRMLLHQVLHDEPRPPRKLNDHIPRDLETICLKCLQKEPARRYVSAEDLAEDLRRFQGGEPIRARRTGAAERAWRWCRRKPGLAGAIGATAAALVAVAALSLLYAAEQTWRVRERTDAAARISGLAKNLAKESDGLKVALTDSNRRLAMVFFERAQRAFDGGRLNHGLLWLVESWRWAVKGEDPAWQRLARANLSLWRYQGAELRGVFSHGAGVHQVIFGPDGKTILTRSEMHTARLWDVASGLPIGQVMTHSGLIMSAALSPDGKLVLTAGTDRTARLWDATDGRPVGRPLEHRGPVNAVAFSPDGKTIFTGGYLPTVRLWDTRSGQPIGKSIEHTDSSTAAIYSPDGKTILTLGFNDRTARLWDAATGRPLGRLVGFQVRASHAAFSPDGKTVLTESSNRGTQLWDVATGQPIGRPVQHEDRVTSASFSPDGKAVLTRSFGSSVVRLWDVSSWVPIGKPLQHQSAVNAAEFSPDGKTVLTGSDDRTARLWDAATSQPMVEPIAHQSEVSSVAFSPDGKLALTGSGDTAFLWEIPKGLPVGQPLEVQESILSSAYSPDGKSILTIGQGNDKSMRLWDATTGLPLGQPMSGQHFVSAAAFTPDGKTILAVSREGNSATLWNTASTRPIGERIELGESAQAASGTFFRMTMRVLNTSVVAAFSPDGKTFFTLTTQGTLRVWNSTSLSMIIHQTNASSAAFSTDGKTILIASKDRTARLWDAASGRPIGKPMEHSQPVSFVGFSTDGARVITVSGGTATLWNATNSQAIGPLTTNPVKIYPIAVAPEGNSVLALSGAATLRMWDISTGQSIGRAMVHQDSLISAAFSRDGRTILTGSSDNRVRLWDAATGQTVGPALLHQGPVGVAYGPDGRTFCTETDGRIGGSDRSTARLWFLPELVDDDLPRMRSWVETITGLEVDAEGNIDVLSDKAWQSRRQQLAERGGPPKIDSRWLFDPILYGDDPTARVRAWMERAGWNEAESAIADVVRARPRRSSVWIERGRLYVKRSELDKAAADFVLALALGDRDPKLFDDIVASDDMLDRCLPLLPGDASALSIDLLLHRANFLARQDRLDAARAVLVRVAKLPWEHATLSRRSVSPTDMFAALGCSDIVAAQLRKHGQTTNAFQANELAWNSALSPGPLVDREEAVRLAEIALNGMPPAQKHLVLNTLGAALYRASRFEEAIRRLEEAIRKRNGAEEPLDWPFLAMAHQRLGHHHEARRWLNRILDRQPIADPNVFWEELAIRRLRREAEAVVLWDPGFPSNPFAQ